MAFERFGSARLSDDLPIDDWMDSQNEAVARRDDLAAAGRDAWVASTESGANLGAARPGDVVALGDISPDNTAHAPTSENLVTRVARSPAGPGIAHGLGFAAGIMRGAAHTVEGLGQAALLSVRFGNPGIDRLLTPFTGGTAGQQVARTESIVANAVARRVKHPGLLAGDSERAKQYLFPGATPRANTPEGELKRRFQIGANEGELALNGVLVAAAPASEVGEAAVVGSRASEVERFIGQGWSLDEAEHLAERYPGKGHHSAPQRWRWPAAVSDSPFFLLRPGWMNRGRFYERHFKVDPYMYGSRMKTGMRGWSGNRLGLEKYGPLEQFWFGTTTPFKTTLGATIAGNNAANLPPPKPAGTNP